MEKATMGLRSTAVRLAMALCLSAGLAHAQGNEKHLSGKITQISCAQVAPDCGKKGQRDTGCEQPSELTVQSTNGQLQVVEIVSTTQFVTGGAAAAATDLKVGDQVEVDAKLIDGELDAVEVRFASTAAQTAQK